MNEKKRQARRYHWHSKSLSSFVDAPHNAIEGPVQSQIVNLTDNRAAPSRNVKLNLLVDLGPDCIVREYTKLVADPRRGRTLSALKKILEER